MNAFQLNYEKNINLDETSKLTSYVKESESLGNNAKWKSERLIVKTT